MVDNYDKMPLFFGGKFCRMIVSLQTKRPSNEVRDGREMYLYMTMVVLHVAGRQWVM